MNCPQCHQPLREGAQFCTHCGARMSQGGVDSAGGARRSAGPAGEARARDDSAGESVPTVRREGADSRTADTSAPTVVESDPLVGRVLDGKYEVVAPLGAGGMGAVYLARRVLTADAVAVKVLPARFINNDTLHKRSRREARAAAQLPPPTVVTIHDYGEARGILRIGLARVG